MAKATTMDLEQNNIVYITKTEVSTTKAIVQPIIAPPANLDQSNDIAERAINSIDTIIKFMENTAAVISQYNALGGASCLDKWSTQAPNTGPTKDQLVAAIESASSLLNFINTGHNINFYLVKTRGSSPRY